MRISGGAQCAKRHGARAAAARSPTLLVALVRRRCRQRAARLPPAQIVNASAAAACVRSRPQPRAARAARLRDVHQLLLALVKGDGHRLVGRHLQSPKLEAVVEAHAVHLITAVLHGCALRAARLVPVCVRGAGCEREERAGVVAA
jgi:hypothetical protein